MRKNEYNNIEEFIEEYAYGKSFSWQSPDYKERFIGIEFFYNNICYRMCREPGEEEEMPLLNNGKRGRYATYISHVWMNNYKDDDIILLNWYSDLYDVLENWFIEGKPFKEVIIDDNTIIWGKD